MTSEPVPASLLERRAGELLRSNGIEGWVPQYRPPWYDGLRGVVDLAWPEDRMVVELDGRRWHATTQAQAEDRRRDRAAAAHGRFVLRFGWQEVMRRPGLVVGECRTVLEGRRRSAHRQVG